jgi:phosphatidylethanolamine-binding protein (PEBP) family uncharacterized protein
MRRTNLIVIAALLGSLALSGCGSTEPSTAKVTRIPFTSTAFVRNSIPARYTCDGQDVSPSLEWGAVPADTGELVLFVLGFRHVPESTRFAVSVEWVVAGIKPTLHGLAAGVLPHGARAGRAENGKTRYSICPAKGAAEQYQFELYAMPASTAVPRSFVGTELLNALNINRAASPAIAHGAFVALYKRK